MADAGQLVCVLAGPKAAVEKVRPYTKGVMGRAVIDFSGQEIGKATLMKVIGNTLILNMVESLSEGHVLAEKSGLGSENLHQLIENMFPGPYAAYSTRMISGDYHKREEPAFSVDLAKKDARRKDNPIYSRSGLFHEKISADILDLLLRHLGVCGVNSWLFELTNHVYP